MPRLSESQRKKVCGILYVHASRHPEEVEAIERIAKKLRCFEAREYR